MSSDICSEQLRWVEDEGVARKVNYETVFHARSRPKSVPAMTMDEIKRAVEEEGRVLIVISGRVFDVKSWAKHHPGGVGPLYHGAGKDMTDQFIQFHSLNTHKRLAAFHVANLAKDDVDKRAREGLQRDWDTFTQAILAEGLYRSNYLFFAGQFIRAMLILGTSVALVVKSEWVTAHVAGALLCGLFLQQMNFLGHDVGHNGITHNSTHDAAIGVVVGNLLTGVSISWWKDSHNNHHVACNSIEGDADIQHLPFICCNPKIMEKPFFSTWHKNWHDATGWCERHLLRYQHFIYYPAIMGFARYNLYIQGWLHIFKGKSRIPLVEAATLLGFLLWFGSLVSCLPTTRERVAFVLISHAAAGVLNVQITLSHFCMEVYHGSPYNHDKGIEDQWVWTQMRTTLALTCAPWMDWFHGGLQFQDVHHLLPRVPRHNLRALRPRIRALCKKHGCDVSPEMSFMQANITTMQLVRRCAAKACSLQPGAESTSELRSSPLWETLYARG